MKNLHIAFVAPQPFVEIRGTSLANLRLAQIPANGCHSVDVITYPFGKAPDHPGVKTHRCRPLALIRSVGIGFSPVKLLTDLSLASLDPSKLENTRWSGIRVIDPWVSKPCPSNA